MNFSWGRILIFFCILFSVGVLIYPSEYFLGQMHMRDSERYAAIDYFKSYLKKNEANKGASVALANAYESIADLISAHDVMSTLAKKRKEDPPTGFAYLEFLERAGYLEEAQKFRWDLAQILKTKKMIQPSVIEELLYTYYINAQLDQNEDDQQKALLALMEVAKNPGGYRDEVFHLALARHKYADVIKSLETNLTSKPQDVNGWILLSKIQQQAGRKKESMHTLARGLKENPENLTLLEYRVYRNEVAHQYEATLADLEIMLRKNPKNKELQKRLAFNTLESGYFELAVERYEELLKQDYINKKLWLELIYAHGNRNKFIEATTYLGRAVKIFPYDTETLELLVYYLDRQGKKLEAIPPVENYLNNVPEDLSWSLRLIDLYIENNQLAQAEQGLQTILKKTPNTPSALHKMARIMNLRGNKKESIRYYQLWLEQEGEDPEVLKIVGMESFFEGDLKTAKLTLTKAAALSPNDADVLFYLAETHFNLKEIPQSQAWAKKALVHLNVQTDIESQRKRLRLLSHSQWSDQMDTDYLNLSKDEKAPAVLFTDWMDGLLTAHKPKQAKTVLAHYEERFPLLEESHRRYRFQIASEQQDWKEAVDALDDWVEAHPSNMDLRRPLGEAAYLAGDWKRAEKWLLESRDPNNPDESTDRLLEELRGRYYPHGGPSYHHVKSSNQTIKEVSLNYRATLKETFSLEADITQGNYSLKNGPNESALIGKLQLSKNISPRLEIGSNLGAANGNKRDTLAPGGFFKYQLGPDQNISGAVVYRRLWNDLTEAVIKGGLASEAKASYYATPFSYLNMGLRTQWSGYELANHNRAERVEIVPETMYVFHQKPFLALGYQYAFSDVSGDDEFFNNVALVQRIRTHQLSISSSHWLKPRRLMANAYLFNGHDDRRDLKFTEGDLIGGGVQMDYFSQNGVHLLGRYGYGKESATGAPGESHLFDLKLEVRWFGYDK